MIIESVLVVISAVSLDLAFGDPKNRYHPTAWTGALIAWMTTIVKCGRPGMERLGGMLLVCVAAGASYIVAYAAMLLVAIAAGASSILAYELMPGIPVPDALYVVVYAVAGAILLKTTLAIRGMERHARMILDSLDRDDIGSARNGLSMIVKRDTSRLDQTRILSGTLESIGESIVDGITGPLFYYALFGLPGAFAYRAVNTADSMIGYKSEMFRHVGWFAARCDTVLNYVPARITGMLMVAAAALLGCDWRSAYAIMMRDRHNTASVNAGYPMAALAGALGIRLEKTGHYTLGGGDAPSRNHVMAAISIMKVTTIMFVAVAAVIILILWLPGWWIHA